MNLGERLKELRKNKHKTLRQVSEDTTISNSNLSEIENGIHGCNADTLNILAKYYNVSVDYLLGKTDNPSATIVTFTAYDADGTITNVEYEMLKKLKDLTAEDMIKVDEYIDFIKSKNKGGKQ